MDKKICLENILYLHGLKIAKIPFLMDSESLEQINQRRN